MYRTIDAAFWTDPTVRKIGTPEKLLFLYLITNPHTHVSGIYILPREVMSLETGIPKSRLDTLCHTLSEIGFCSFDEPISVVWVRNMFEYQGPGEKNAKSAAYHLAEDLHKSILIIDFCGRYPRVRQFLPEGFLDRVSIGYPDRATPDSRSLIPDSRILIPDGGGNTLTENLTLAPQQRPANSRPPDEAFETFVEIFNEHKKPAKYPREDPGGFIQLAKVRKAQGTPPRASPPEWRRACVNYLITPREKHTLADLCTHYATFVHSPVDRYGKPFHASKSNSWEGAVKPAEAVAPHKGLVHRCEFCSGGPHEWKCDFEYCELPSVAPCRHYIETKRGKNEKINQARVQS